MENVKTLGDVWAIFEKHGLEGKYCPVCDQFSQARVLSKQDEIITDLYEALKHISDGLKALGLFKDDTDRMDAIIAEADRK